MRRFFVILCLVAFGLSLSSCAAMRKRKCNKCPKFNQVEPQQKVDDICAKDETIVPNL